MHFAASIPVSIELSILLYLCCPFLPIQYKLSISFKYETTLSISLYVSKYETGENDYTINPENYKKPIDFYNELKERNLFLKGEKCYGLWKRQNKTFNWL